MDPVVIIKMVLLQHLYGIPSLREAWRRIDDSMAFRWFLEYNLLDRSNDGGTVEKTVSTTDPECRMFVKGEHERQFAYEAHTACDENGFILGVEVTVGNVSDSVAWDKVYNEVTGRFPESKFIVMDAGYKTPWIAKRTLEYDRIPVLPYTRKNYKEGTYRRSCRHTSSRNIWTSWNR